MPPHSHIYLLSGTELCLLHEFLDDMLGKGIIQSSQLPGSAPVLFAKKDGTLQLCVDFQNLNKITWKDQYPIPLVINLLDQLGSAKVYTKLDTPCWLLQCSCRSRPQVEDSLLNALRLL